MKTPEDEKEIKNRISELKTIKEKTEIAFKEINDICRELCVGMDFDFVSEVLGDINERINNNRIALCELRGDL